MVVLFLIFTVNLFPYRLLVHQRENCPLNTKGITIFLSALSKIYFLQSSCSWLHLFWCSSEKDSKMKKVLNSRPSTAEKVSPRTSEASGRFMFCILSHFESVTHIRFYDLMCGAFPSGACELLVQQEYLQNKMVQFLVSKATNVQRRGRR